MCVKVYLLHTHGMMAQSAQILVKNFYYPKVSG